MLDLLALLVFAGVALLIIGTIGAVLKLAFWLVLLPFRLAIGLIMLPVIAVGFLFKLALGALLLPVIGVVGVLAVVALGIAAVAAVIVPLLPLAVGMLVVWGLVKLLSRPAAAPPPPTTPAVVDLNSDS